MDLSKEINALIDKQYDEIRQGGHALSEIERIAREMKWKEPYLAQHVYNRLMKLAKEDPLESRVSELEKRLQTIEERMEPPEIEITINEANIKKEG